MAPERRIWRGFMGFVGLDSNVGSYLTHTNLRLLQSLLPPAVQGHFALFAILQFRHPEIAHEAERKRFRPAWRCGIFHGHRNNAGNRPTSADRVRRCPWPADEVSQAPSPALIRPIRRADIPPYPPAGDLHLDFSTANGREWTRIRDQSVDGWSIRHQTGC